MISFPSPGRSLLANRVEKILTGPVFESRSRGNLASRAKKILTGPVFESRAKKFLTRPATAVAGRVNIFFALLARKENPRDLLT